MRQICIVLLGLMVSFGAFAQRHDKINRESEPDVYFVEKEDQAMAQAITKARRTFTDFANALQDSSNHAFAVKVPISENGETEHMWLSEVVRSGENWIGVLANVPLYIKSVKMGDPIVFTSRDISDWYFIRDKRIHGGYSLRVFRDKMTTTERQEFDDALGVIFE